MDFVKMSKNEVNLSSCLSKFLAKCSPQQFEGSVQIWLDFTTYPLFIFDKISEKKLV